MRITRKLEFDAGHRIANHLSSCRNLHGHRYVIEITLSGNVVEQDDAPDKGMVMDFSQVREIADKVLVDVWDHAFIVDRSDKVIVDFLRAIPNHKTVEVNFVPSAENLCAEAFRILDRAFSVEFKNRLTLDHVRLYETPNCWADVSRKA